MIGALGDGARFGIYRNEQQHYIGPVLTYDISPGWSVRIEPAFGLSRTSDPFVLRTGIAYTFGGSPKAGTPDHSHMGSGV